MDRFTQLFKPTVVICCTIFSIASSPSQAKSWLPKIVQYDLWERLRGDFTLPNSYRNIPAVKTQIDWYAAHPKHLEAVIENAAPYLEYVVTNVEERSLPGEIALLPLIESNFDPFAYSHAGATGIWQMMPGTASGYGIHINWWYDGRRDIVESTKTALDYLTYLGRFFDENWLYAIAAYDSGEGTVQKAINKHPSKENIDFWHLSLPRETKSYVPKLLALKAIILNPEWYDIHLPEIENEAHFTTFTIPQQVALSTIAEMAHMPLDTLRMYNPGYRRASTEPETTATFIIPNTHSQAFKKALDQLRNHPIADTKWQYHLVKSGDSLSKLAQQYHTSVQAIMLANHLQSSTIKVGMKYLIPAESTKQTPTPNHNINHMISQDSIPGPKLLVHTVKHGETLEQIAARYKVKLHKIQFWNNIYSNKRLTVNKELVIWQNPTPKIGGTYTVKPGDSLSSIAHHFHTSVKKLMQQNHMKSDKIRIKQTLIV